MRINNPTRVITGPNTRWSYANVWEPKSIQGGTPKYSVSLLIPKNDQLTVERIKTAIKAAYQEGAGKLKGNGKTVPPLEAIKNPLRDGDLERPDDEAYRGHWFLNANASHKPGIVDSSRQEIIDHSEVYSGVYGRASVNFYAFNVNGNKGIACGLLLNAFDAVRVHKFGNDDDAKSFKEMEAFALEDPAVKSIFAAERAEAAAGDFAGADLDWMNTLDLKKSGEVKETLPNLVTIMREDPNLVSLRYNSHRGSIDHTESLGALPWTQLKPGWNDTDDDSLKVYLNASYGIYAPEKTRTALKAVTAERAYHPIREYLESLPEWDGNPRLNTIFSDYLGTPINAYTMAVCRKTFTAAVARIFKPGTKFDSAAILVGRQGLGKSTLFKRLAGDWFSDALTMTDMRDKTAAEKLQGYWILELGELAGMRKAEVETVKAFMSRDDDKYRAAYGVNVESHPRQCVIVGSTNNEDGFLRDITGNRRFWPLHTSDKRMLTPWDLDQATADQIWAEALAAFRAGEDLYLSGTEAEMAEAAQKESLERDEREGIVSQYLETLLPPEWAVMNLSERRNFLSGANDLGRVGTVPRETVCNMEIWCECFMQEPSRMRKQDSYEINGIMSKMEEWERAGLGRVPLYGPQRIHKRKNL